MDYEGLGRQIRHYRTALHMTQNQLSRRVGISATFLSRIEGGHSKVSVDTLVGIARALDVSMDELLFGSPEEDFCYTLPQPVNYFAVIRKALDRLEAERSGRLL